MKTSTCLAPVFALALGATLIGCGGDPAMSGDGPDQPGPGPVGTGSDMPPKPLDATGRYALHSTFDLATHMPGTAGQVVNTIIAATDEQNDPTKWILEQLIAQIPSDEVRSLLNTFSDVAAGAINSELGGELDDVRSEIVLVGGDFSSIAKQFGLIETLELTRSGDGYTAVHTVSGVHFKLGNQNLDFAFANYQLPNVVVNNVGVTMDQTGQLTIAAHDVPLAYGQILRVGLDAGIIPLIDSSAQNLGDLLKHEINCQRIGTAVSSAIASHLPFGLTVSADTIARACNNGLDAAAAFVYSEIGAIDSSSALKFGLSGTAKGLDRTGDRMIDTIQTGTWGGTLDYGNTPTQLAPSAFYGERM